MTSPMVDKLATFARAVMEHDELEWPKIQAYANGLRENPDDTSLLSAAIELLDGMSSRRMARRRLLEELRDGGVLDETVSLAIADLADEER